MPSSMPSSIEAMEEELANTLRGDYPVAKRALVALLLEGDKEVEAWVREEEGENYPQVQQALRWARERLGSAPAYLLALQRQEEAARLLEGILHERAGEEGRWRRWLHTLTLNPWTGIPLFLLVLYFGLYQFVGVFGAGTVVDWLENTVFPRYLDSWMVPLLRTLLPWPSLQELFVGEYGIWTLGMRYAVALILPIVSTFFLVFAVLEDSGYLPRLAMLIDRVFKRIGLNGRAVIPIVLGFGCDTMATIVTRILETKRERFIATLLLALAIPCSAQLGVILAILSSHPRALLLWAGVVGADFLLVGYLAAKLLPGEPPRFYLELPPLRWPLLSNVLMKTVARMQWYFFEVLPLFLLASVLIWVGRITGLFPLAIRLLEYPVEFIGLPKEAAVAFLFGFFRRDYGAAGLYDLREHLTGAQLLVAATTLTLFIPCVAQFLVMKKERGWKQTLAIASFILLMAFGTGALLNATLRVVEPWLGGL